MIISPELARDLITSGESAAVEFKETLPKQTDDFAREVAALATVDGGYIFVGVRDDGSICGLSDCSAICARIEGIVQHSVEPFVQLQCSIIELESHQIVCVSVKAGDEPVYYAKGRPMLRQGTMSRVAKPDEVKHLILKNDALNRLSQLNSESGVIAAGIVGQGDLATMNYRDLVKRQQRAARQRLA